MADKAFTPIFGDVLRVVRLDACGAAVSGTTGQFVTEGFIKVERKPQYDTGAEYIVKNARGDFCVNRKVGDRLKRMNLTITLCEVDPEGIEMMSGARLLKNGADSTGNAFAEGLLEGNWSLEVWQELAEGACTTDDQEFVHHLFPLVENGTVSDLTIEEGPSGWVINANTRRNEQWSDPFGQWLGDEEVGDRDHHLYRRTTVVPPTAAVGYQTLTLV